MFSVENWSNYLVTGKMLVKQSDYAVVDLSEQITTLDGRKEPELICRCPTKEKAVWLVQILNKTET